MAYRSDETALEARRVELERELGDVKARVAEAEMLTARQREIERELERIEDRAVESKHRKLPMLQRATIATPCTVDWYQMIGDDRVRFCGACKKDVYNVSAMTAAEAEALMQEKGVDLCARLYRRKDGTVMTSDCSVGVQTKWTNRVGAAVLLFVGGAAALMWFNKTFGQPVHQQSTGGAVSYLPPG